MGSYVAGVPLGIVQVTRTIPSGSCPALLQLTAIEKYLVMCIVTKTCL